MGAAWTVIPADRERLRALASRIAEIAHSEQNAVKRRRWTAHNDLQGDGAPMILAETCGLYQAGEWTLEPELQCTQDWARGVERQMRMQLQLVEDIGDDTVLEPRFTVAWHASASGYGVQTTVHRAEDADGMGAYRWDPPLKRFPDDLDLLTPRTFTHDAATTYAWRDHLADVLDGLLTVEIRGSALHWWSLGLTGTAVNLVGLDTLMLLMIDDPDSLHRLMQFLHDDALAVAHYLEQHGLLSLNNENDYVGSGSCGYTTSLPAHDFTGKVRLKDLWVLSESQETVGVGPDMFEEFIFPYQRSLCERFGLTYYGCCEPVHSRWHVLEKLPNLRKVSVSPWCDEHRMAEAMGRRYVFCRKPNPTLISTPHWDEDAIRTDVRHTLQATRACHLEIVMKDVHTLSHEPWRLARWVSLARDEIARRC